MHMLRGAPLRKDANKNVRVNKIAAHLKLCG